MTHNTWARKYLKTMCKNFMTAFQMGYADGTAGNERQSPPFPEEAKPFLKPALADHAQQYRDILVNELKNG